eukprot:UN12314
MEYINLIQTQKQWSKILQYNLNFIGQLYAETAAYNKEDQLLYVFNAKTYIQANILTFNLKHNKLLSCVESPINGSHRMIYLDQRKELHQIGGNRCDIMAENGHYVWDKKMKKNKKHQFDALGASICSHGLIYLHSKQCILLFGGELTVNTYSDL